MLISYRLSNARATPARQVCTAIQDSFDLGWKLAWVLRGWAPPSLLDSYQTGPAPSAAAGADTGPAEIWLRLFLRSVLRVDALIGRHPDGPVAARAAEDHLPE